MKDKASQAEDKVLSIENLVRILLVCSWFCGCSIKDSSEYSSQMIFNCQTKNAVCFDYKDGKTTVEILKESNTEESGPKPLVVANQKPIKITSINQLTKMIQGKRVIFYTGAGISAEVIPTMNELLKDLGDKDQLAINVKKNPGKYIQILDSFFKKCERAEPTKAHIALHNIISKTGSLLITENLDLLHQKSGDAPLTRGNFSETHVDISKVDYIVTIGLASDESGFLNLYKKLNPNGIIIAINTDKNIEYLSNKDFILQKDAQIAIPEMLNLTTPQS
jgi:NAD-dependent deacetylase